MLIDEIFSQVLLFANKSQIAGYLSVNDFNRYASFSQLEVIDSLHSSLDYNMASSILISDVLKTANVTVTNGMVNLPSDYYKYADSSALFYDGGFKEFSVDYIGKTERSERLRSKIVDPTNDAPIATEGYAGLKIDPKTVERLELTYVFLPPNPEWVGTDTVPPVFLPDSSTDFVLSEKFKTILTYKICSYFSIEIRDGELSAATTKQLIQQM